MENRGYKITVSMPKIIYFFFNKKNNNEFHTL